MNQIVDLRAALAHEEIRRWYKRHGFTAAAEDMEFIRTDGLDPLVILGRLQWCERDNGIKYWPDPHILWPEKEKRRASE